jgi:hypothetical protein
LPVIPDLLFPRYMKPMTNKQIEKIHTLWDELADFEAAQTDAAVVHLMKSLCDLVGAQYAYWLGGVRVKNSIRKDILYGWRPKAIRYLHELPVNRKIYKTNLRRLKIDEIDESTLNHVRQAGRFRATLIRDHVSCRSNIAAS